MRIAYFAGTYPRATDTFIQREVMALRQRSMIVFTFAVRSPAGNQLVSDQQKAEKEQTYYLLPTSATKLIRSHLQLLYSRPKSYGAALRLAWQTRSPGLKGFLYQLFYFVEAGLLASQVRQSQIQHLHNHFGDSSCSVAMLAATLGGFDYSFTLHGPGIFYEPIRWRLDEKIRRAKFVSCISHFCRSQAMVFSPFEKWPNLKIIHCGIEPHLFQPVQHQSMGHRLLYVGRLAVAKGLPILLLGLSQIKANHPNIRLTIVGDGPDRQILEDLAQDLNLADSVHFVGYQSQVAVRQYLQNSDIFVMSSFAEGIPVVLMEAMASGLPVVATQVAGISELVETGYNGYLVPPGDVQQLVAQIQTLIVEPELRQQMGARARQKVSQDFNISQEVEKLSVLILQSASLSPLEQIDTQAIKNLFPNSKSLALH